MSLFFSRTGLSHWLSDVLNMKFTNSLSPAMASCRSTVFHSVPWTLESFLMTFLLSISWILEMPLPMKDYVSFSNVIFVKGFLILPIIPGSAILYYFYWILCWVLIHKLKDFHRVYVLNSQPHGLVLHWAVNSVSLIAIQMRMPLFFELLVKNVGVKFLQLQGNVYSRCFYIWRGPL